MPSKYPVLQSSEVIQRLEHFGFSFVSQKGSHRKYKKGSRVVIVPMHDEIAKGTLKSILQQAGLSLDEFLQQN